MINLMIGYWVGTDSIRWPKISPPPGNEPARRLLINISKECQCRSLQSQLKKLPCLWATGYLYINKEILDTGLEFILCGIALD